MATADTRTSTEVMRKMKSEHSRLENAKKPVRKKWERATKLLSLLLLYPTNRQILIVFSVINKESSARTRGREGGGMPKISIMEFVNCFTQ